VAIKKNRDSWFSDFPKKLIVAVASLIQPVLAQLRAPLATLRHLLFFEKIKSTIFKKCTIINNIANTYGRI